MSGRWDRTPPDTSVLRRWADAILARCTCVERDKALPPLVGHEPDCSLQNTGWLS